MAFDLELSHLSNKDVPATPEIAAEPIRPRLLRHARASLVNLNLNPDYQFAREQTLCIYPAGAVCSFIPKNASTTLRFSIAVANGCIAKPDDFEWIHNNNNLFIPTLGELASARYAFAVLRDPFRRLASCYMDQIVNVRPESWTFISQGTTEAVTPYELTFRQFVVGLEPILELDIHWRPQIGFLVYEDYDDWFSVENFPLAEDTIRRRIGLELHDARKISPFFPQRTFTEEGRACMDLPASDHANDKVQRGTIPRVEELYDSDLIERVRRYYAADIALYGEKIGLPLTF